MFSYKYFFLTKVKLLNYTQTVSVNGQREATAYIFEQKKKL